MADPLEWQFKIFDGISKPATDIAKSIDSATTAMDRAAPAADKLDEVLAKGGSAVEKVRSSHDKLAPAIDKTTKTTAEGANATLKAQVAAAKLSLEAPRLQKQLAALQKEMNPDKPKKFGVEFGNLFHTIAGFRSNDQGGLTFNIAEGIQTAVNAVERLASAFGQVSLKALETAAAGEKTGRAFKLNLGEKAGGDILTYYKRVIAESKGLYTLEQLSGYGAPLARQHRSAKDFERFTSAGLSVGYRGGDPGAAIAALSNVRTNRAIDTSALAIDSFEDKAKLAQRLARVAGVGGGLLAKNNPEELLSAVSQRLSLPGGQKRAENVEKELLNFLAEREAGGKLGGDAANAQRGTAATVQRFQNLPQTLYEQLATSPAIVGLYQSLDRFVDLMQGPAGAHALNGLADAMTAFVDATGFIIQAFSPNATTKQQGAGLAYTDSSGTKRVAAGVDDNPDAQLSWTAKIDRLLGRGAFSAGNDKGSASVIGSQTKNNLLPDLAGAGVLAADKGQDLGESMGAGFFKAFQLSKASEGMGMLVDKAFESGNEAAEVHSPSRRSARLAGHIIAGFTGGIGAGQGQIDRAMDRAFAIDDVAGASRFKGGGAAGGAGGGTGGGMTLQIAAGAIRIDGAGMDKSEIAAEVLRQIEEKAPGSMISIAEQLSDELGGG